MDKFVFNEKSILKALADECNEIMNDENVPNFLMLSLTDDDNKERLLLTIQRPCCETPIEQLKRLKEENESFRSIIKQLTTIIETIPK